MSFDAARIAPLLSETAAAFSKAELQGMTRARDARVQVEVLEAITAR